MFNKEKWVDIKDKSNVLVIKNDKINFIIYGEKSSSNFKYENNFDNTIKITISSGPFEYLIKSIEKLGEEEIEIISGIMMEYDGRGPVVFNEFVKDKDYKKIPKDFRSDVCKKYNDVEPVKTYMAE